MSNSSDASSVYAAMAAMLETECKVSMLWNWHTVDACFLSARLRITSPTIFGFSCVAVVVLVMSLECLRRLGRIYDHHVFSQPPNASSSADKGASPLFADDGKAKGDEEAAGSPTSTSSMGDLARRPRRTLVRPTFLQQMLRTAIYTMQFAVGYLVMLLAMSHNGYVLICIFIGAFLGFAIFAWEGRPSPDGDRRSSIALS